MRNSLNFIDWNVSAGSAGVPWTLRIQITDLMSDKLKLISNTNVNSLIDFDITAWLDFEKALLIELRTHLCNEAWEASKKFFEEILLHHFEQFSPEAYHYLTSSPLSRYQEAADFIELLTHGKILLDNLIKHPLASSFSSLTKMCYQRFLEYGGIDLSLSNLFLIVHFIFKDVIKKSLDVDELKKKILTINPHGLFVLRLIESDQSLYYS